MFLQLVLRCSVIQLNVKTFIHIQLPWLVANKIKYITFYMIPLAVNTVYTVYTVSFKSQALFAVKIENVLDREMQIPIQSWEMTTYPLLTESKKGL
jgi:hypothetical protein